MIEINCDMGESWLSMENGTDGLLMNYVNSINISCGFHAGDYRLISRTIQMALSKSLNIGAHPSYDDEANFGRKTYHLSAEEIYNLMTYQLGALNAMIESKGGLLHHVKPHGALYNQSALEPQIAEIIAKSVFDFNPNLILYGLAGSSSLIKGSELGLKTFSEAFADRNYLPDGTLCPRNRKEALIVEAPKVVEHVKNIKDEKKVRCIDGKMFPIKADTICLHSDTPNALEIAKALYEFLQT
jgi:5-oxoprolinase (ATP-hydrolysing) subunit A